MKSAVRIINKKAKFEFILHDSYVAGIVLSGSEIKSIRNSKASIRESFCKFTNKELFIINMSIEKYDYSNDDNYNPKRSRKLLLNKIELNKLKKSVEQKGSSIIPISYLLVKKVLQNWKFLPLQVKNYMIKEVHWKTRIIRETSTE